MLRLTLRSGKDGRFLCRIIDRGGFPFVLDFGDRRIIEDASQRILHGFTMWRYGRLVTATPQDVELILQLAEHYASEGLLVFLEEPTWAGRDQTAREDALAPPGKGALELPATGGGAGELLEDDDSTEVFNPERPPLIEEDDGGAGAFGALLDGNDAHLLGDLAEEDAATELAEWPETER
jgi:hypothetical protein